MAPLTKFNTYNKTPVTFVTGVDLHLIVKAFIALSFSITKLARKCQRRRSDAAGVLLVRQSICDEAYDALFVFNSPGWRESARGEERMPPAYFWYVKAFVTKHMVLYSSAWYYLPGKNGHTIGITIRDTMKHTITRPQPAFR